MFERNPTFEFTHFTLTLLLLSCCIISVIALEPIIDKEEDEDLKDLEELLALEEQSGEKNNVKESEISVLSKAQRIVIDLTNENAKRIIDENVFVLVLGYAPWCPRSSELMPRFAEAASDLKELGSSVLLAKLDAENHPKAASLLGIKGFPTLLLFVNGTSYSYNGGQTAKEIVIWTRKKTGDPVIRLFSKTDAKEFLAKNEIFVIGLFYKFEGPEYREFLKAAVNDNEIQFVETNNAEVVEVLYPDTRPKEYFLGLVKSEMEKYVSFEEAFEEKKLLQFLEYNKFPLVTMLTELNSVRVYSSSINIQVFLIGEAYDLKNHLTMVQDVAKKFKSKILFVFVDLNEDDLAKPILTLFGIESEKLVVTAFDNKIGSKYLLESDLTSANLEKFCSELLRGVLFPHFKSEPIPDTSFLQDDIVQKVVGRTFDTLVLNNPKNVFLEVHTPWCISCESTSKLIVKLAKHFKTKENLFFARIDASSNEHPKLKTNDYPTLLFYPSGDKLNPIELSKKSSMKDLISFIKSKTVTEEKRGTSFPDQPSKDEL